jgi:uncharacterized integral membrane protein (TIGR00698 family)
MSVTSRSMSRPPHVVSSVLVSAKQIAPGLAIVAAVAFASRVTALMLPPAISEVAVALLLGLLVASAGLLPGHATAGIRFASRTILRVGIVLLGARLSLGYLTAVGAGALGLVVLCMTTALTFALLVGRVLHLPPRLALLIGVGTTVCGNSAIVATAPVIGADDREVGFAVATITVFGTFAVFAYPVIGRALGLADTPFGLWTGVAVNDTSQVVAASAAYSPAARDVATVVKLVRNTLMAPLIMLIAWWWQRGGEAARRGAWAAFPMFILGFLAFALMRTVGLIGVTPAARIDDVARLCILMALAGVGLGTKLKQFRAVGVAPFCLGLGTAALLAILGLAVIIGLGLGQVASPLR